MRLWLFVTRQKIVTHRKGNFNKIVRQASLFIHKALWEWLDELFDTVPKAPFQTINVFSSIVSWNILSGNTHISLTEFQG